MINKIKKIILDHLLSQNDWMQSKLIEHKSKILAIEISGYKVIFIVEENGQLRTINESEKIDCTIKLTINDFINQIVNNQNGKLALVHGSKMFMQESTYTVTPKVGDFYFFPNYLMHTVYPFSGTNEERRSVSFNATIDDNIFNVFNQK